MCDCYTPQGVAIPTNKRANAARIFNDPKVAAEVTWYEYLHSDFKFSFYAGFHSCSCSKHIHGKFLLVVYRLVLPHSEKYKHVNVQF